MLVEGGGCVVVELVLLGEVTGWELRRMEGKKAEVKDRRGKEVFGADSVEHDSLLVTKGFGLRLLREAALARL